MSFSLGKTRLRVHPLLPLTWGVALMLGSGTSLRAAIAALAIHESGHWIAAKGLGIPVTALEITPFGGVMTWERSRSPSALPHFLFTAAGPAFSLAGCLASAHFFRWGAPLAFVQSFARANFLLLVVNLLPALPLDGGEMLRALLTKRLPHAAVTRLLTGAGYAAALLLCAVSILAAFQGVLLLSPLFAGVYLMYAATVERRENTARYVTSLIGRRQRLEKYQALPVEWVAVGADTPARLILPRLSLNRYHMICVLSRDGMDCLGYLDEKAFCDSVLSDPDAPVGRHLQNPHQKSGPP